MRIRRNCTMLTSFNSQASNLRNRFLVRGYPIKTSEDTHKNPLTQRRHDLLLSRKRNYEVVRIIGTYDNQASKVRKILERYWGISKSDEDISGCLPSYPKITFGRGISLKDCLVHSHYEPPKREGSWLTRKRNEKCGQCKACAFVTKTKEFSSTVTKKKYTIFDFANRKKKGLVYLCWCSCPKDYIGKTKCEFRRRILDHIGDIRNRRNKTLAKHVWDRHKKTRSPFLLCG